MSEIYEAIKKMTEGTDVADVGVVTSVDAEGGRCDVEIAGKAPAMGAWLRCGGESLGVELVPAVGSRVVVLWLSAMVAVVVMAERVEQVVMRGGANGGLVNVEVLKEWMQKVEEDMEALQTLLKTTPVAGNGAPLGLVFRPKTQSVEDDIEDETIKH